jgi:hypothetical protein
VFLHDVISDFNISQSPTEKEIGYSIPIEFFRRTTTTNVSFEAKEKIKIPLSSMD